MSPGLRRVLAATVAVALAAAASATLGGPWAWLVALAVAVAGAAVVTRIVGAAYAEPLVRLAAAVREHGAIPGAEPADIMRAVASEFRDAVTQLADARADGNRREAALRHTTDGVVLVDAAGVVEYANPAAKTLLHERLLEASRRLVSPELDKIVRRASELGAVVSEEVVVRTPAVQQVLARAIPLAGGGVVLLLQDLSESYRLDRLRRDFVANVSHELKTPVASVRALADVASSAHGDGDVASAARFLEKLRTEAERLSDLVADLLDLSTVEAARELDMQPLDALEVARTAAQRARTIADGKGVPIEVLGASVTVDADATQIAMAVQNLVDNAVRYSESGTVRVSVARDDGWARIEVADEGIGIPESELARIFERFYRVDRARTRATGGTGLGLSIVRHVAENHGGRIEVQSELGVGSTFTLVLPAGNAPKAHHEGAAA